MARLGFLYTWDWSKEAADYGKGLVPSHRLFGQSEMRSLGHTIVTFRRPESLEKRITSASAWKLYQALLVAAQQKLIDAVVCTHESTALPVLLLKKFKLISKPIVLMNVALLEPRNTAGSRKSLWTDLLKYCDAIMSFASYQSEAIAREFKVPLSKLHFVRFGVDTNFFRPESEADAQSFLLSVGTNPGKDYVTLLKSLPSGEKLVIVTDAYNMGIIKSFQQNPQAELRQDVPIKELRTLYAKAKAVVLPLKETSFSSGQTVLLECMAMGKEIVVADTSAVRDYLPSSIRTYPPEDSIALRECLEEVSKLSDFSPRMELVEFARQNCDARQFAKSLSKIIGDLIGGVDQSSSHQ